MQYQVSTPSELELSGLKPASGFESSADPELVSPDPDNPPWGLLAAFLTWIGSIFLLVLPVLFAVPYLVQHYRGSRPTAELLYADKTYIIIVMAGILPAHLITLFLAWAVATRRGKYPARKVLGWSWKPSFGLWQSVSLAILLFLAAWIITLTLGGQETELERIILSSRAAALIIAFVAVATAPLVEEVIYRGILFPALQRRVGAAAAVSIVTLLFAAPHVQQYWPNFAAILSIALLSAVLTIVRARTGRLLPCFVIHLVFNGIQSLLIVFEPYLRAVLERSQPPAPAGALIQIIRFLV